MGKIYVGSALTGIALGVAVLFFGASDARVNGPFVLSGSLVCDDGRSIPLKDAADFDCGTNVGALLHLRVGFPNGGFEEVVGMAPYWPVKAGDCWPTVDEDGKRSICDEWSAEHLN